MLTVQTPEQRSWPYFSVFIVNIEHILVFLVFLFLTLSR